MGGQDSPASAIGINDIQLMMNINAIKHLAKQDIGVLPARIEGVRRGPRFLMKQATGASAICCRASMLPPLKFRAPSSRSFRSTQVSRLSIFGSCNPSRTKIIQGTVKVTSKRVNGL